MPPSVRPQRPGNQVTPLVHGASYFPRLVEAVLAAGAGDLVWLTDWRGDADQLLRPEGPSVAQLFGDAARRGVDVRGLLWRSHSDRTSFSAQENEAFGRAVNTAGGCALLDERVRRGGSHHQKLVVVRYANRPADDVAFVGGIDLCHSRRDDETLAGDDQRQPMDRRYGPTPPWHDATVEIRGPAVRDVQDTFIERWTDPTPVDHRNPYRRWRHRAADMPRHPTPMPPARPAPATCGPHVVQVLRTYGAKRPRYPFAPDGERTVAAGYERAFGKARQLIYIEDQYLWSSFVARTLATALERHHQLQVIAVVPRYPDDDGRFGGPPNRWGQLAALRLLQRAGGDRFNAFDLHNPQGVPVYVHAKICIVDDAWMTCGSDNFNRRSWTHDSEATVAVVDAEGRLPRELRLQLWAEHLQLPRDDSRMLNIEQATALWKERAQSSDSRIALHRPAPVGKATALWASPLYRTVFDPDGRPIRTRIRRGTH